jgi:hypothetical protein
MNFELFVKTLTDGYSAYFQLLSWVFPYFDRPVIGAIAAGSTVYFILKVAGVTFEKTTKQDSKEEFIGPKYLTVDDMVTANIRAILKNEPQPFSKEDIASMKERGRTK